MSKLPLYAYGLMQPARRIHLIAFAEKLADSRTLIICVYNGNIYTNCEAVLCHAYVQICSIFIVNHVAFHFDKKYGRHKNLKTFNSNTNRRQSIKIHISKKLS